MAIGTASVPELTFSMGTALPSACVLSEKRSSKFQRMISVPFDSISVYTEGSIYIETTLPIKLEAVTRKNQPFQKPKIYTLFELVQKFNV